MHDDVHHLKLRLIEEDELNTNDNDTSTNELGATSIHAQLRAVSQGLNIQTEKHMKDYRDLTNALQKMQSVMVS